jgi:hypothetical protein
MLAEKIAMTYPRPAVTPPVTRSVVLGSEGPGVFSYETATGVGTSGLGGSGGATGAAGPPVEGNAVEGTAVEGTAAGVTEGAGAADGTMVTLMGVGKGEGSGGLGSAVATEPRAATPAKAAAATR